MRKAQLLRRAYELRRAGWQALVAVWGLANAIRFILQYEQGRENDWESREESFGERSGDGFYAEMKCRKEI